MKKQTEKLTRLSIALSEQFETLSESGVTLTQQWADWAESVAAEFKAGGEKPLDVGHLYRDDSGEKLADYSARTEISKRWGQQIKQWARPALQIHGLQIHGSPNSYWDKANETARRPADGKQFRIDKRVESNHTGRKPNANASDANASDANASSAPTIDATTGSRKLTPMQARAESVSAFADMAKQLGPMELLARVYEGVEQAQKELGELATSVDQETASAALESYKRFQAAKIPAMPRAVARFADEARKAS